MKINPLSGSLKQVPKFTEVKKRADEKFDNVFSGFVKQVNKDQITVGKLTEGFINGEDVQIHDVMIAGEKAKTSLDLLMEIRNKTVDMWKELSRLQ
ncbi:MAG: flagellar hook-basal body complex protein FliE [Chlorobi bacterium]|nr:flagellar hook-basal body complex protein FliE [Chlorobiota bacterium]